MILGFVILYLLLSVGIGLAAARRVHNTKDFALAGRSLPLPVVIATVFATWFGAEAVLGISSTFVKEGLRGVVADPFGSSLCLILAGLFFAPRFYRMNLLTVGDFYRLKYNRTVEVLCTLCIVASYLGWVAAQFKVLGLVLNVVTEGAVSQPVGMVIGALIVLTYTTFGGMFSVAILDFVQISVIMGGLLYITSVVSGLAGGVEAVISHAAQAGKLDFFPRATAAAWIPFIGAWITMMLGSIPQQDVFQRITSAKDERTAVRGSVLGGVLYFCFCFVPMFLAYAATLIDPTTFTSLLAEDAQLVLPTLILRHTPVFAQIVFFGAVLSAVMSCASATLLAPSVMLSENVLKGLLPQLNDWELLRVMRLVVVGFAALVLIIALNSSASIYQLVVDTYKVTLVAAFVPLCAGLFWSRATTQGALYALAAGLMAWLGLELFGPSDSIWPPQLVGLFAAAAGMVVGSLLPQRIGVHG
ncbi:MAG: sodium:solute symporter family protein [Nitrospiraceae bacterium]|jgi:SSS family solute:Na+ symporter|nr:sodium:solute symporter family protein [Nitrospira sp.]MDW7649537.1 sodium:solute symporter family protein [Nitrospiraceae bacterium]PHX90129.1 MAG: sodium:solute symporter [Nitrospirota bacterium]MBP0121246.1 sodium:solute symporter family protein [Nitrospira sp.]MBP0124767.1 sodium:solute symporter family protein [Nitrospira sp.]